MMTATYARAVWEEATCEFGAFVERTSPPGGDDLSRGVRVGHRAVRAERRGVLAKGLGRVWEQATCDWHVRRLVTGLNGTLGLGVAHPNTAKPERPITAHGNVPRCAARLRERHRRSGLVGSTGPGRTRACRRLDARARAGARDEEMKRSGLQGGRTLARRGPARTDRDERPAPRVRDRPNVRLRGNRSHDGSVLAFGGVRCA
jgi:hypothetical protein